jgi:hypothetical protein
MPQWVPDYLNAVRQMLNEAHRSGDPRVKMTALRILERQVVTIRELELELKHWLDSLAAL